MIATLLMVAASLCFAFAGVEAHNDGHFNPEASFAATIGCLVLGAALLLG